MGLRMFTAYYIVIFCNRIRKCLWYFCKKRYC